MNDTAFIYRSTALVQQAKWVYAADWALELLHEPSDPEMWDILWARDVFYADFPTGYFL